MPRLTEEEREDVLISFQNHWKKSDSMSSGWEIVPGYGLAQFQQQCDAYRALVAKIKDHTDLKLPRLRVERDSLFGKDAKDETGVWYWLSNYKGVVRAHLGKKHPLSQTIPTMRRVSPQSYGEILDAFLRHWDQVNQTSAGPMMLGTHTYNDLQSVAGTIKQKMQEINAITELELPLWRAEREIMFGDVSDDLRSDDSLVSRMQVYQTRVATRWPNEPMAKTLPRIFPAEGGPKVPEFEFNWLVQSDGKLQTWFFMPSQGKATHLFLQEGNYEKSLVLPVTPAGQMQSIVWEESFEIVGDLDRLELRDDAGRTLAQGVLNPAIPHP